MTGAPPLTTAGPSAVALAVYPDRAALARALAAHVAEALRAAVARDGVAGLAVSGGRTPDLFLAALSGAPLPWDRITVTLVDERWVDENSPRSNAALVRAHLLRGPAAAARFVPLHADGATPEAGLAAAEAAFAQVPRPLAAVVLGMGDDGHTASFFPGAEGLSAAIAPGTTAPLAILRAPAAGEPRISLTLPVLLAARCLLLHIEGDAKRRVLDAACQSGDIPTLPIRAILRHRRRPLDVLWCP